MALLTDAEQKAIDSLTEANAAFMALPVQHPSDRPEWVACLHRLQDLVAARPTYRATSLGRGKGNGEQPQ